MFASVANLADLPPDLATFQTPSTTFSQKNHLMTNLLTFRTNFGDIVKSIVNIALQGQDPVVCCMSRAFS